MSAPGVPGMSSIWTQRDIPDLTGRRALVTGVTSGIGAVTALELARHGSEVVLAARSADRLDRTAQQIAAAVPGAQLQCLLIDLSELASVRRAAKQAADFGELHLLVNNAGVMATPYRRTGDGFELQFATNHLGPFALTGLLLPQLVADGDSRVVAVSSMAHRFPLRAPLGDPHEQHGRYSRWHSYGQSKLANLMFTYELDRRLREAGLHVKALAAHPGLAATGLVTTGHGTGPVGSIMDAAAKLLGQPSELGALPTLMAATADLPGSTYVGPGGPGQARGYPQIVGSNRLSHDLEAQRRLWEVSESVTGMRYP
ncbi:MAG: oxidoreductase [Actinomycetota bacterium]|nr:oxidoreductase [Actinomycetota bacterium]